MITRQHRIRPAEPSTQSRSTAEMAHSRSLAYQGVSRAYNDGRDEDYSPNDEARSGRDRKPRKRNSVAVRILAQL